MMSAEPLVRYVSHAIRGKIAAHSGRGIVPETCQIPNIRAVYDEIGLPRRGHFVEIGAFDGHQFSNTSFLADEGWTGLYIEPIPKFARLTRLRHIFNHVSVETVAVDTQTGTKTIHAMGPLSTTQPEVLKAYGSIRWAKDNAQHSTTVDIKTERLETVFTRNNVPERFDLLVIDTEGSEEQIVRSLLESRYRPSVVIAELSDKHGDFEPYAGLRSSHQRARTQLLEANYRPHYEDGINTLFRLG